MIRVLICDDHFIVRQGLKQTLGDAPDVMVIDEADSSADCTIASCITSRAVRGEPFSALSSIRRVSRS